MPNSSRQRRGARSRCRAPIPCTSIFRGCWLNKGRNPGNVAQARRFFDHSLIADPETIDALVGSARVDALEGGYSFVPDPRAALAAAEVKLIKALSSVADHALGQMCLEYVCIATKRAAQGIAECEHALALDRNLVNAHSLVGLGKIFVGRAEETEAHVVEALRLSPRDSLAYLWMTNAGLAKLHLGSWEEAVAWCRRVIEANRSHPNAHFWLAAAITNLDQRDEARTAVQVGLALNPSFTVSRARAAWTAMSDDPTYLAGLEPVFEGLRMVKRRVGSVSRAACKRR